MHAAVHEARSLAGAAEAAAGLARAAAGFWLPGSPRADELLEEAFGVVDRASDAKEKSNALTAIAGQQFQMHGLDDALKTLQDAALAEAEPLLSEIAKELLERADYAKAEMVALRIQFPMYLIPLLHALVEAQCGDSRAVLRLRAELQQRLLAARQHGMETQALLALANIDCDAGNTEPLLALAAAPETDTMAAVFAFIRVAKLHHRIGNIEMCRVFYGKARTRACAEESLRRRATLLRFLSRSQAACGLFADATATVAEAAKEAAACEQQTDDADSRARRLSFEVDVLVQTGRLAEAEQLARTAPESHRVEAVTSLACMLSRDGLHGGERLWRAAADSVLQGLVSGDGTKLEIVLAIAADGDLQVACRIASVIEDAQERIRTLVELGAMLASRLPQEAIQQTSIN